MDQIVSALILLEHSPVSVILDIDKMDVSAWVSILYRHMRITNWSYS